MNVSEKRKRKKSNPGPAYVTVVQCSERHTELSMEIKDAKEELKEIKTALIGNPMKGEPGLVQHVKDIKKNSKSKLTGRDKALIIGSFLTSVGSVLIAYIASLS